MVGKPAQAKHRFTVFWADGRKERGALVLDQRTTEADAERAIRKQIAHYFGGDRSLRGVCLVKGELTDRLVGELSVLNNQIPINTRVTQFFHAARRLVNPSVDPRTLPNITGPAVVFDKPIWPSTSTM